MSAEKRVIVIGAGLAGISAATCLAEAGYDVTVLEKNSSPGGRARQFVAKGFAFDMGPSWYWMPDVFENYFSRFGRKVADYYQLVRIAPSYRIFFGKDDVADIPADTEGVYKWFESLEKGSSVKLRKFLAEAEYKYEAGMKYFVYKPGRSLIEYIDWRIMKGMLKLHLFRSFHGHVRRYFTHPRLIRVLEFPVLFLGAMPKETPALYSLMNHADLTLGTWYPMGGMYRIVESMEALACEKGVRFLYNSPVDRIVPLNGKTKGVMSKGEIFDVDIVIGGADYHHVEHDLLDNAYRDHNDKYWQSRRLAPSCLIYYLGINKRIKGLLHHNLFFDTPFEVHAGEIYSRPKWPSEPLFYACCPSKTDASVAPAGKENLFILIPVAPGLGDNDEIRDKYYHIVMDRMENLLGESIREHVIYKRSYAQRDFENDYNAYRGNAYGLANTLKQTAILKPSIKSRKISNLYYTGQLTVPGPGVPPALISGQVVADEIMKDDKSNRL